MQCPGEQEEKPGWPSMPVSDQSSGADCEIVAVELFVSVLLHTYFSLVNSSERRKQRSARDIAFVQTKFRGSSDSGGVWGRCPYRLPSMGATCLI